MSARRREDVIVSRLQALGEHLDGEPDPGFRAATRARLVAMAAVRTPAPARVSPLRRLLRRHGQDDVPVRWQARLTAGLAGAALSVTALAAVVAVAEDARPGDVLYNLKRGTEQTQLALAGDARGQTLLGFASTRLDELEQLVRADATALPAGGGSEGPAPGTVLAAAADTGLIVATLDTMDDQTTEGAAWLATRAVDTGDADPLSRLSAWAAEQSGELATLRPDMPTDALDELDDSIVLLSDITDRTVGLRTALDCASGPATNGGDRLGPVPGACRVDQPAPGAPGETPLPAPSVGTSTDAPTPTPAGPSSGTPGSSGGGSGSSSGGGPGRLPVPSLPSLPSVPGLPSIDPSTLPVPLPLPGSSGADTSTSSGSGSGSASRSESGSGSGSGPGSGPAPGPGPGRGTVLDFCLPPLATFGVC